MADEVTIEQSRIVHNQEINMQRAHKVTALQNIDHPGLRRGVLLVIVFLQFGNCLCSKW